MLVCVSLTSLLALSREAIGAFSALASAERIVSVVFNFLEASGDGSKSEKRPPQSYALCQSVAECSEFLEP